MDFSYFFALLLPLELIQSAVCCCLGSAQVLEFMTFSVAPVFWPSEPRLCKLRSLPLNDMCPGNNRSTRTYKEPTTYKKNTYFKTRLKCVFSGRILVRMSKKRAQMKKKNEMRHYVCTRTSFLFSDSGCTSEFIFADPISSRPVWMTDIEVRCLFDCWCPSMPWMVIRPTVVRQNWPKSANHPGSFINSFVSMKRRLNSVFREATESK